MARVLLVEDNPDVRDLVERHLQRARHQVVAASDGSSALAAVAERGAPDVAVLDVGLPDGDGFALLEHLRSSTGEAALPAVFLTGLLQEADIARGRALGATYLTKPFIASALLSAVERATTAAAVPAGW